MTWRMASNARRFLAGAALIAALAMSDPGATHADDKPPTPVPLKGPVSLTINPATRWQARGGTVVVAATSDHNLGALTVTATLGWTDCRARPALVRMRPPETGDKLNTVDFGVVIPSDLESAPFNFQKWLVGDLPSTGLRTVPVAQLCLEGVTDGTTAKVFDVKLDVGITNRTWSRVVGVTAVLAVVVPLALLSIAPMADRGFWCWLRSFLTVRWILQLIRAPDGTASLSSFQVLLWTLTVFGCAVCVMVISGQLVDITPGTLTLLGIAGATRVMAALKEANPTAAIPSPLKMPRWSDVLRTDQSDMIDVTRIQMLFFTVVCATFVVLQVLTTDVIPDIPSGYLILIGLSNGVYIGRKLV